jgi:hypothetical protein
MVGEVPELIDLTSVTDYAGTINLHDNDTWSQDEFPFYCLVGIVKKDSRPVLENGLPTLNVAVFSADDEPIVSFQGTPRAMYKHLSMYQFSPSHLAYLACEIGKAQACAIANVTYVQD